MGNISAENLGPIKEELGLQEKDVPTRLAGVVSPTFDIKRRFSDVFEDEIYAASGQRNAYVVPTGYTFYMTGASISVTKDATSDGIFCDIYGPDVTGKPSTILGIKFEPLTAGTHNVVQNWSYPIKFLSGSIINLRGTFAAGTETKQACIQGFLVQDV